MTIFVAIDGGASKTHIVVVNEDSATRRQVTVAGTGLSVAGAAGAWRVIDGGLRQLFDDDPPAAGDLHVGIGIAGFNNRTLHGAFLALAPAYGRLVLAGDGHTSALGAHGGAPGSVVALGTGSVGYRVFDDFSGRQAGGWGFPVDDAGGGSWVALAMLGECVRVLDGRLGAAERSPLHDDLIAQCGGPDGLVDWLHEAASTKLATLAPMILAAARRGDKAGQRVARAAAEETHSIARALDPEQTAPVSIIGGLAEGLAAFLPTQLTAWARPAQGSSVDGALLMARGQAPGQRLAPRQ